MALIGLRVRVAARLRRTAERPGEKRTFLNKQRRACARKRLLDWSRRRLVEAAALFKEMRGKEFYFP